jgi:hypothetical protein
MTCGCVAEGYPCSPAMLVRVFFFVFFLIWFLFCFLFGVYSFVLSLIFNMCRIWIAGWLPQEILDVEQVIDEQTGLELTEDNLEDVLDEIRPYLVGNVPGLLSP